jgi:WD40 repeat protein
VNKSTPIINSSLRFFKPTYHAHTWKLVRVISGRLGWVRSVAVEPGNKWFAPGSGDRIIKIRNLALGELRRRSLVTSPLYVASRCRLIIPISSHVVRTRQVCFEFCKMTHILMRASLDGKMLGPRGQQGHPSTSMSISLVSTPSVFIQPLTCLLPPVVTRQRGSGVCAQRRRYTYSQDTQELSQMSGAKTWTLRSSVR